MILPSNSYEEPEGITAPDGFHLWEPHDPTLVSLRPPGPRAGVPGSEWSPMSMSLSNFLSMRSTRRHRTPSSVFSSESLSSTGPYTFGSEMFRLRFKWSDKLSDSFRSCPPTCGSLMGLFSNGSSSSRTGSSFQTSGDVLPSNVSWFAGADSAMVGAGAMAAAFGAAFGAFRRRRPCTKLFSTLCVGIGMPSGEAVQKYRDSACFCICCRSSKSSESPNISRK